MHLKLLKFQRKEEFMMNKIQLKMIRMNSHVILLKMNKVKKMKIQQITVICIPSKVHNKKK